MSDTPAAIAALFERSDRIAASNPLSTTLRVAGLRIRIVSAGPAMLGHIGAALAHLPRVPDDEPADLTVTVWDSESRDEPYPDLRLPELDPQAASTVSAPGVLLVYRSRPRSMSVLDRRSNRALFIAESVDSLPAWERPAPLRALLSWWLVGRGKLLAHSAAVATDDGAALLIGPSGSGKSSTSLVCMAAGMGWLGDDYVVIDPGTGIVSSVFGSAKLTVDHHDRHPELLRTDGTIEHDGVAEKHYGFPSAERPEQMCLESHIRAVVLPVVTHGSACRLKRTTSAQALLSLAPTTMFHGGALKAEVFSLTRQTVEPYDAHRLELGAGVDAVPEMLGRLIASGAPRR